MPPFRAARHAVGRLSSRVDSRALKERGGLHGFGDVPAPPSRPDDLHAFRDAERERMRSEARDLNPRIGPSGDGLYSSRDDKSVFRRERDLGRPVIVFVRLDGRDRAEVYDREKEIVIRGKRDGSRDGVKESSAVVIDRTRDARDDLIDLLGVRDERTAVPRPRACWTSSRVT
jgi:hypothetical protein